MNKDNIFSMILYGNGKIPKYFELNKESIKFIVILFPAITALTIIALISTIIYFQYHQPPLPIATVQKEVRDISSEKTLELEEKVRDLANHLESIPLPLSSEFSIFKQPISIADSNSPEIITDLATTAVDNKLNVTFRIVNNRINDRITGFAHVILAHDGIYSLYPKPKQNTLSINYQDGLPFSASLFRPVTIDYPLPIGQYELKVFIFSRNGNLIAWQKYSESR